ncbi:hypothetical protein BDZ97DRAFT_1280660 [Flammula alnicola]|nr:hypothetical protein BDZ97DRAFT_1280660 [Flammula alnicola]
MTTATRGCIGSTEEKFSRTKSSRKTSLAHPAHIKTNLPCPADEDLDEVPHPVYTPNDISRVQRILLHFVPAELADAIIDLAEYWPYVGVSRNAFASAYSALDGPDRNAQWCYLVSPRIPSLERDGVRVSTTVKMVKFMIKTYESSWGRSEDVQDPSKGFKTWFETSIMRKDEPPEILSYDEHMRPNDWFSNLVSHPRYLNDFGETQRTGSPADNPFDSRRRWHVTDNPESTKDKGWHEVVWRHDDKKNVKVEIDAETGMGTGLGFIDSLSVDDRIILMARALVCYLNYHAQAVR